MPVNPERKDPKWESSCSLDVDLLATACFLSWGLHGLFFSAWPPQLPQPLCVWQSRAKGAQAPHIRARLPFSWLFAGTETSATHVSDQVQPASLVSKHAAPGKPTESTFILCNPVTCECVIHYSVIRSLRFSSGPLANSEALGERAEELCLLFVWRFCLDAIVHGRPQRSWWRSLSVCN